METKKLKDPELNRCIKEFTTRHKNAAIKFCEKNGLSFRAIHCTWNEDGSVNYEYDGKPFMVARMIRTQRSKHPFRIFKKFIPLS